MTSAIPYSWLKQLPASVLEKEDGTPFGYPPAFPWEQLSAVLAKLFEFQTLKITCDEIKCRSGNDLITGLGASPIPLHIDLAPLSGTMCWLMARKDWEQLMSLLLTKQTNNTPALESEYLEGFYQFLALEIFSICGKLDYEKGLSPHLLSSHEIPNKESYCLDISIQIDDHKYMGRLAISDELRQGWKERFAERTISSQIPKSLAQKINFPLTLDGGGIAMKLSDWQNVVTGDFLTLDRCGVRLDEGKSMVTVLLHQKPIFLAQIKGGNLKILDYPLYREAPATMANQHDEEDDMDDFDIDLDTEMTFTEEHTAADTTQVTEEYTEEHQTEEHHAKPEAQKHSASRVESAKPLDIQDLKVEVVVEVGRLEVSIEKLTELQPGSLLELNLHPEDGVDLTINGQVVAKAELIKIGDLLGVRILDKG